MKLAAAFTLALLLMAPRASLAQTMKSCPDFGKDVHVALDCIEGIFSETPLHLTLSGVPPGNGLPIGLLYDKADEHVGTYRSRTETTLAFVGSTNGSLTATGSFNWFPPLHYSDAFRDGVSCHRLGWLCTQSVFSLDVYGTYRSIQSLSFYGLGSLSPATEYLFKEREGYGGVMLRMPLTDWLRVDGGVEDRKPFLPSSAAPESVSMNFSEATAPGLTSQPNFLHSSIMFRTSALAIAERATNPLAAGVDPETQPLMKPRVRFQFQNSAGYHWYRDLDSGRYSFQQFVFEGDESIAFGSVIQRFAPKGTSWVVDHLCDGPRVTQTCSFGTLDVKSLVQLSNTTSGHVVPFYFQPTLGGADIESRTSLRGFDNYRFRDNNAAVVQVELTRTFKKLDPLGIFVFYDAGVVGPTPSGMWSSSLRQDAGAGLTIRLQGKVVMQFYAAAGAGHGLKFGYNFEKLF